MLLTPRFLAHIHANKTCYYMLMGLEQNESLALHYLALVHNRMLRRARPCNVCHVMLTLCLWLDGCLQHAQFYKKTILFQNKGPWQGHKQKRQTVCFQKTSPQQGHKHKRQSAYFQKTGPDRPKKVVQIVKMYRVEKNRLWYPHPPPKNAFFNCSKESGLNSDSKFLVGRKEPTHVSGFVLIRLGAKI